VFCRLIRSPEDNIIFENERLVVFPDIRPAAMTHLLVVPKEHIANTDSLEARDLDLGV
jgi:histidine triad (HIT) family protein